MINIIDLVLVKKINGLIDKNEYGVSIVNLPSFNIKYLCKELHTLNKTIEFYIIGGIEEEFHEIINSINNSKIKFSFSVEEAEESRNNGNESIFRIIVIKRNDVQKMTSLEWFNKITMDEVYKMCCEMAKEKLGDTNTFIVSFIGALIKHDLKRLLNFEEVISFLNDLYYTDSSNIQPFINNNLYKLCLCSDSRISEFKTSDDLKARLKENKRIINSISDLDKKERQNINSYASDNPGDHTPRFILEYYKTKNKELLKSIDFDKAITCLSKKRGGGSSERQKFSKISPTAFASKLIFEDKKNKIGEYINDIGRKFDKDNPDNQCILVSDNGQDKPNTSTSIKYDEDSYKLTDSFVDENCFGVVYSFDAESPSEAVSKCDKNTPIYLDYDFLDKTIIKLLDDFARYGVNQTIKDSLLELIESRKKLVPYKNRLKDFAMLEVLNHFTDFYQYLKSYEKLLTSIETDYRELSDYDAESAKTIVGGIMALDMIYFISDNNDNNTYAIPTPLNPLYLWKYIKLSEELLDSSSINNPAEFAYLSDKDKDFIIRKSEDIPNPLSLFLVPDIITGNSSFFLPINGNLGVLPVYCAKQLIDDSYSNIGDISNIISKYMFLYPHSSLNLKMVFINPPSVNLVAKVINSFDNNKDFDYSISFDITVLKTNDSSKSWVEIDDDTLNAGLFSKIKNDNKKSIDFKVIDKIISYDEVCQMMKDRKHLVFIFDPNEKKIELSPNNRNIHIHPLCVPKVYEYQPVGKKRKVSNADNEGIFNSYATIIEKIKDQAGASIRHNRVFYNSPLKEETYRRMLTLTDWIVIFDKNLKTWDIALNSNSEKLYFSESDLRSIGVYSLNPSKLKKGYQELIFELGNYISDSEGNGISNVINTIRSVNNDGLLSILSKTSNKVFDKNQGKGSLGLAITSIIYKNKYPDSIIVSLDTQLAREWLSNRSDKILPDLVAIRHDNDKFYIDIIEVKTYQDYSIDGDIISGHSVNQVTVLDDEQLLGEMFSRSEKITTVSRREILREQVFDYIFNVIVPNTPDEETSKIIELINNVNKLFAGEYPYQISKHISHIDFGTVSNSVKKCYTEEGNEILLNVIGQNNIQKVIGNEQLDAADIIFFDPNNTGLILDQTDSTSNDTESNDNIRNNVDLNDDVNISVNNGEQNEMDTTPNNESDNIDNTNKLLIQENCKNLYTILKDYGIKVKPIDESLVQITSRFFRFKVELYNGESINKIERYKDDIARGLEAQGAIMISNVLGTKYVAIDVCYNMKPKPLPLLNNLGKLDNCNGSLDILAGESVDGKFEIIDLAEAVHMLIAGTTGSGKTIFLYNIICSLLYKHNEKDLDLIIVDPKQTDFNFFANLKCCHDKKIIFEPLEAIDMIKWINDYEKDRRTALLRSCMARDIVSYNLKNPNNQMKRIVVIIDEYADLVNAAESIGGRKEFETTLCQLAQRVRNIGIHIILATQRPSASIVTSTLKANMPFRISFKLPQHQDSQTILDRSGAEDLLGKGDMLVLNNGTLLRLQSCYVDADTELVGFLKKYE